MKSGRIFDIQSFSVHDGPGCRTSIFFSGCPLRCGWCANPESHSIAEQLLFSEKMCIYEKGCDNCRNVCKKSAISFDEKGKPFVDHALCKDCSSFACTEACTHNAFRKCGSIYSVDKIMKIIIRDLDSWGRDGGVTFSGGEPLLQHEFLCDVLDECKKNSIHTAIETSAYADEKTFFKVMEKIDFGFIDIKNMDNEAHISGTGVSNEIILSNIKSLKLSGWQGRLIIRQPVINGYNDSIQNAEKMVGFMNETGWYEVNLLKFHRLGKSKWEQLGKNYLYENTGDISDNQMKKLQNFYLDNNIACYLDNEIMY